jgi:hypothetical protein
MEPTTNITRNDVQVATSAAPRPPAGTKPAELPRALFVAEIIHRSLTHVVRDRFRGDASPARLSALGAAVLVRADPDADEVEAFLRLRNGAVALIDGGYGHVDLEVAADLRSVAVDGAALLHRELESDPPAPAKVSIGFWTRSGSGGEVRHRDIDAPSFDSIAENYAAPVRAALERLISTTAPDRGRLILWRGAPGTGKSHALRALVRAWAPWCSAHFIMDPEELLGSGGTYLLDLLSWDDDDEARWRLLILEDAGELIAADARSVTGQALSRLLNVTDGLLGQGTRTLLLITTNEPVKRLHPAARRSGRCLADIEFTALSADEANAWLTARGRSRRVSAPATLAELFGQAVDTADDDEPAGSAFGFSRALIQSTTAPAAVGRGDPRTSAGRQRRT